MKSEWVGSVLWLSGLSILAFLADKTNFSIIMAGFSLSFGGYLTLSTHFDQNRLPWLLTLAILGRLLFLPSLPALSDDFYRFIWDGNLQLDGIPILEGTPRELVSNGKATREIYGALLPLLNSPDYHTVYPPVIQWINYFAAVLSGSSVGLFVSIIRCFHLLADLVSFFIIVRLVKAFDLSGSAPFWFVFNPLLITEGIGNLHFDGLAVCALLVSLYYLRSALTAGIISFAAAVMIKLTPLLLLPLIILRMHYRKGLAFLLLLFLGIGLGVRLNLGSDPSGFLESLSLYFQSFEFNGGIYYLVREFVSIFTGYNAIDHNGPGLAVISALLIMVLAWKSRTGNATEFYSAAFLSYSAYLLLSTTLHPWYVLLPFSLAVITQWRDTAILWSYLIVFSYSHYWDGVAEPRWGWIIAEYLVLISWIIWKYPGSRRQNA